MKRTTNKVHDDCPLTQEEMTAIKAELYYVNSTNQCINPPAPSWYRATTTFREQQQKDNSDYIKWLENELKQQKQQQL